MIKKILLLVLLFASSAVGQEPAASIKVPEWVDFQSTQEKLVEQNQKMLGELTEVRTNLRQINIKLIEILGTTQQQAATAGRDVHCDLFKTKYDYRIEYGVVTLAFIGVYSLVNWVKSFSNKKPVV